MTDELSQMKLEKAMKKITKILKDEEVSLIGSLAVEASDGNTIMSVGYMRDITGHTMLDILISNRSSESKILKNFTSLGTFTLHRLKHLFGL